MRKGRRASCVFEGCATRKDFIMGALVASVTMIVLVIFYLVLLVRWQHVRRPQFFLLGCGAIILNMLLVGIFSQFSGRWAMVLTSLLTMALTVIAFGCAVLTCYQAELPIELPCCKSEGDAEGSDVPY